MKYFVIFLFLMGFIGIVYAMHDPNQPYTHSIILPPDVKGATFEEFMKWCEPYYKERCADIYEKNKTSKSPIPLNLNNLASELWYDHDYIIGGTILGITGYGQSERIYDIQINSFFKPEEGMGSKVITVYGYPNFYNVKGDSGIFFIKKHDAKWVFGEYGAKATPECPPELMYHQPIEPQVYTRVPASGTNFDHMIDCYPHYYKKYLPQYMKFYGATQFPSPFSQIKDRVPITEVVCNEGLTLIQKHDDTPACVTESTKQKLIEREWTKYKDGITVNFSFCGVDESDAKGNLNKSNSTHIWDENECEWYRINHLLNENNTSSLPFGWTLEDLALVNPIYVKNPNNPNEVVLDIDSMIQIQRILEKCDYAQKLRTGEIPAQNPDGSHNVITSELRFYNNGTHYIDSNTCNWIDSFEMITYNCFEAKPSEQNWYFGPDYFDNGTHHLDVQYCEWNKRK